MLNRLALISNPKMKNQKARVPFLIAVFCFEINLIKGFSFFCRQCRTVGKFLPSQSEAETLVGSEKNIFLLIIQNPSKSLKNASEVDL